MDPRKLLSQVIRDLPEMAGLMWLCTRLSHQVAHFRTARTADGHDLAKTAQWYLTSSDMAISYPWICLRILEKYKESLNDGLSHGKRSRKSSNIQTQVFYSFGWQGFPNSFLVAPSDLAPEPMLQRSHRRENRTHHWHLSDQIEDKGPELCWSMAKVWWQFNDLFLKTNMNLVLNYSYIDLLSFDWLV